MLLALGASAGCGLDVGASQPWVPIADITGPLATSGAAAPRAAPVPGAALRVVTYNVDEENNTGAAALAAAITRVPELASADVFMFEEEEAYPEEGTSRSAQLAALLGVGYVYVPARVKGDGTHGLAIMSTYPIENVEKMDLPATNGQPRIAVAADIRVGDRVVHLIDVHLETFIDAEERVAQLAPAALGAPDAVVLAGDFNMGWLQWLATGVPVVSATRASDQAPVIDSFMRALGFADPSLGSGPTAHAYGQATRLDAVFARGLDVTFGGVSRVGPSDHWPLWFDVRVP